jgi:hypothetical protein
MKDLEQAKWQVWHDNVFQTLNNLESLEMDLARRQPRIEQVPRFHERLAELLS